MGEEKILKEKLYEVTGVLEYAHCFREEIMARSSKEAQEKIRQKLSDLSDPAIAEFQGGIADLGEEIISEEKINGGSE